MNKLQNKVDTISLNTQTNVEDLNTILNAKKTKARKTTREAGERGTGVVGDDPPEATTYPKNYPKNIDSDVWPF